MQPTSDDEPDAQSGNSEREDAKAAGVEAAGNPSAQQDVGDESAQPEVQQDTKRRDDRKRSAERAWRLLSKDVALYGGADGTVQPAAIGGAVGLDATLGRGSWWASVAFEGRLPQDVSNRGERVRFFSLRQAVGAGGSFALGKIGLRLGARAGVAHFFVEPRSIEGARAVLSIPLVGAVLNAAWPITSRFALRGQVSLDYLPGRFGYIIDPAGRVGTTPRAQWLASVGGVVSFAERP